MRTSGRAVVGFLACFLAAPVIAEQDAVEASVEYVRGLGDGCVYDHGYRCTEASTDDFLGPNPDRIFVPGAHLEAWSASYRDFVALSEMSDEQKRLKHYKIAFTEDAVHYIVLYQGLLLPRVEGGRVTGTLRGTFGWTTKYWIDKNTLDIDKRLFLR